MSELSNDPPIHDEPFEIEEDAPAAQGTLLVTLLLLIAGFLLSSAMLFHYGFKSLPSDGKPEFNLAAWKAKMAATAEQLKKPEAPTQEPAEGKPVAAGTKEKPEAGGINKLFAPHGDRVKWPKLKLTGFGSSTDGKGGFAIINGKQYHPGQMIGDKVMVVEIRSLDVVVEYGGETRTLTVDVQDR